MAPDVHDARDKALRHHRFDLWYGPHHLRFTRTNASEGMVVLRVEERARLASAPGDSPSFQTGPSLAPRFVYQETISTRASRPGAPPDCDADSPALERGREFFDHVARLLDAAMPGSLLERIGSATANASSERAPR
jgi:hypothetical protein